MKKRLVPVIWALFFLLGCASVSSPSSSDSGSSSLQGIIVSPPELTQYTVIPARTGNAAEAEVLTVWALCGDSEWQLPMALQNLRVYEVQGAWNYNINVELGVLPPVLSPGEALDAITENYSYEDLQQAQQRLITELLAGGGPDVMFLDGCYAQDFAERGALMDIGAAARKAGVYENLIDSLEIDGRLYYVPQRMTAPLLWGDPAHMDDVSSFAALAQSLYESPRPAWADFHKDHLCEMGFAADTPSDPLALLETPLPEVQRSLMGFPNEYATWEIATPVYGPWLVQDNRLNTQLLQEQYAAMKQVLDAGAAAAPTPLMMFLHFLGTPHPFTDVSVARYLGYTHLAATGARYTLPAISALARGEALEVRPFPTHGAVWQPSDLIAVNKNAKNPEQALHFIQMMLGDEQQLQAHGFALELLRIKLDNARNMPAELANHTLPVTQSAIGQLQHKLFAENLQKEYVYHEFYGDVTFTTPLPTYEELYTDKGIDMRWMSEAEGLPYDLDALMRQFDTAYLPSDYVANAVLVNFNRYRNGELSLDEAVAACEADVALYLAERQ